MPKTGLELEASVKINQRSANWNDTRPGTHTHILARLETQH